MVLTTQWGKLLFKEYRPSDDGKLELVPCTIVVYVPTRQANGTTERRAILLQAPEKAVLSFAGPLNLARAEFTKLQALGWKGRFASPVRNRRPAPTTRCGWRPATCRSCRNRSGQRTKSRFPTVRTMAADATCRLHSPAGESSAPTRRRRAGSPPGDLGTVSHRSSGAPSPVAWTFGKPVLEDHIRHAAPRRRPRRRARRQQRSERHLSGPVSVRFPASRWLRLKIAWISSATIRMGPATS